MKINVNGEKFEIKLKELKSKIDKLNEQLDEKKSEMQFIKMQLSIFEEVLKEAKGLIIEDDSRDE